MLRSTVYIEYRNWPIKYSLLEFQGQSGTPNSINSSDYHATDRWQTSWLFTRTDEELNWGLSGTNAAGDKNETGTRNHRIWSPFPKPLDHAISIDRRKSLGYRVQNSTTEFYWLEWPFHSSVSSILVVNLLTFAFWLLPTPLSTW